MPDTKILSNPAQEKAIRTIDGSVLLISCPGSGKTTTLIRRIKNMVDNGIDSSHIIMVTFTDAAAKEMRTRFEASYGSCNALFCTIHSLCLRILLTAGDGNVRVIPQDEQYRFVRESTRQLMLSDETSAREILGNISTFKNGGTALEDFSPDGMYLSDFKKIYGDYERKKTDAGYMDFDDMLNICCAKLKTDPVLLEKCRDEYRYIMCDEFQDTNYVQKEILWMLAGKTGNICVVGDDDQSIYGFRGAAPKVMRDFKNDYPDVKEIHMDINYRSMPEIITAARNLIENNRERFPKDIRPAKTGKGSVVYRKCATRKDELEYMAKEIAEIIRRGEKPSEIAILARTNIQLDEMAAVLERNGIPYTSNDTVKDIYEHPVFQDLASYLRLIAGTGDRDDLMRVLNKPGRGLKETTFRSTEHFTEEELTEACDGNDVSGSERIRVTEMYDELMRLRGKPLTEQISGIVNRVGYMNYLISYAKFMDMDDSLLTDKLEFFSGDAAKYGTADAWFTAAADHIRQHRDNLAKKYRESVTISTMHRSKGLEWDTVFIADCCKGITPFKKATTVSETEEERRLFYVAVTRARRNLYIMSYAKKPSGKGKMTDVKESVFIEEMKGIGTGSRLSAAALSKLHESSVKRSVSDFDEGDPKDFKPGMAVHHKGFGNGIVLSATPVMVSVKFGGTTKFFPIM